VQTLALGYRRKHTYLGKSLGVFAGSYTVAHNRATIDFHNPNEHETIQHPNALINDRGARKGATMIKVDGKVVSAKYVIRRKSKAMDTQEVECDNCGMIDVPLIDGYCDGCICVNCKKNAGEVGCSMNGMGWCDKCERKLKEGRTL
jgi:hypothetical protein